MLQRAVASLLGGERVVVVAMNEQNARPIRRRLAAMLPAGIAPPRVVSAEADHLLFEGIHPDTLWYIDHAAFGWRRPEYWWFTHKARF